MSTPYDPPRCPAPADREPYPWEERPLLDDESFEAALPRLLAIQAMTDLLDAQLAALLAPDAPGVPPAAGAYCVAGELPGAE